MARYSRSFVPASNRMLNDIDGNRFAFVITFCIPFVYCDNLFSFFKDIKVN